MELNQSYDALVAQGLGVVAISYDTVEILQKFSERKGQFRFTALADPESKIIESFGIRNPNTKPGTLQHGMAFPGTYIVNKDNIVQQKFFDKSYRQRLTAKNVLLKVFGAGEGGQRTEAEVKPQFNLTAYPSQDAIAPGQRIVLMAEIDLLDKVHLYAPGSSYRAIDLKIENHSALMAGELNLPESENIFLEVIDETVPVYFGKVRISREVTVSPNYKGSRINIGATLEYQTCDDELCYLPDKLPLNFEISLSKYDRQRAPEGVKHTGGFR